MCHSRGVGFFLSRRVTPAWERYLLICCLSRACGTEKNFSDLTQKQKTSQKRSSPTGPRPASTGKQNTSVTRAPFFLRCSFPEISCSTHYTFRTILLRSCSSCHAGLPQHIAKHALSLPQSIFLVNVLDRATSVQSRYLTKNTGRPMERWKRVVEVSRSIWRCSWDRLFI